MGRSKATLEPHRMTDDALWSRAFGLLARCYFTNDYTPLQRDQLLSELRAVLAELRDRSKQLRFC
jgi:hypothetical protein